MGGWVDRWMGEIGEVGEIGEWGGAGVCLAEIFA